MVRDRMGIGFGRCGLRLCVPLFVAVAVAVGVSGCSGSSGNSGVVSAPSDRSAAGASTSGVSALRLRQEAVDAQPKFDACMKAHGVTLGESSGFTVQGYAAAKAACAHVLPSNPDTSGQSVTLLHAIAVCMRAQGYPQWPMPQPGNQGLIAFPRDLNPNSPEVQKVLVPCERKAGAPVGSVH